MEKTLKIINWNKPLVDPELPELRSQVMNLAVASFGPKEVHDVPGGQLVVCKLNGFVHVYIGRTDGSRVLRYNPMIQEFGVTEKACLKAMIERLSKL